MPKAMQIKISLRGAKPSIWRRILIKDSTTLQDLHHIIQRSMPWDNYHMHEFEVNGESFQADDDFHEPVQGAKKANVKLSTLHLGEKDEFYYTYDFGDNWQHQILIEKILPIDKNQTYPFCVKAIRACPPEDCGGIWGFYDMLETINGKNTSEREELIEWIGGEFNPEFVDLEEINGDLIGI